MEADMVKVITSDGREIDFEAAANIMDDDIREELHREGIESEQEFYAAYCERHMEKFGERFVPDDPRGQW